MSKEEQERPEDYLDLERYIEQLHLQRSARFPANLAPQQTGIYSMATFFHTASLRVANPRPEFRAQLYQHLRQQMRNDNNGQGAVEVELAPTQTLQPLVTTQGQKQLRRIYSQNQVSQPDQLSSIHSESTDVKKRKRRDERKRTEDARPNRSAVPFPRRTLFRGGTIAASLLAGAGLGATIQHALEPKPDPKPDSKPDPNPTIAENVPGTWHWRPVTSVEELGKGPVAFSTGTITGYVMLHTEKGNEATPTPKEQVIAVSAACPHLGCIVQWQESAQQFLCPCHGRTFDTGGDPIPVPNPRINLTALPRLITKIDKNGNISVKVP